MTDQMASSMFMAGIVLLNDYKHGEDFSINVIETSTLVINGLKFLPKETIDFLKSFGWEAGNQDGNGWAEYSKIEYVDT